MPRQGLRKINSEKFGLGLNRLRGSRSQADFAKLLGVTSRAVYSRYESGERMPDREVVESWAKQLNVSVEDLLEGTAVSPGVAGTESKEAKLLSELREEDLEASVSRHVQMLQQESRPLKAPLARTLLHLVEELLRRYTAR